MQSILKGSSEIFAEAEAILFGRNKVSENKMRNAVYRKNFKKSGLRQINQKKNPYWVLF